MRDSADQNQLGMGMVIAEIYGRVTGGLILTQTYLNPG